MCPGCRVPFWQTFNASTPCNNTAAWYQILPTKNMNSSSYTTAQRRRLHLLLDFPPPHITMPWFAPKKQIYLIGGALLDTLYVTAVASDPYAPLCKGQSSVSSVRYELRKKQRFRQSADWPSLNDELTPLEGEKSTAGVSSKHHNRPDPFRE